MTTARVGFNKPVLLPHSEIPLLTPQQLMVYGLWQYRLWQEVEDEDLGCTVQEAEYIYCVAPYSLSSGDRRKLVQEQYPDWNIGECYPVTANKYDEDF